jgi:hypothetical protein
MLMLACVGLLDRTPPGPVCALVADALSDADTVVLLIISLSPLLTGDLTGRRVADGPVVVELQRD